MWSAEAVAARRAPQPTPRSALPLAGAQEIRDGLGGLGGAGGVWVGFVPPKMRIDDRPRSTYQEVEHEVIARTAT